MNHSSDPLVSVVVTTYQRPLLVLRALESVFQQTYQPIEIIVIEDGSESDLKYWLQENSTKETHYLQNADNLGLAASRNLGIQLSQGKYIAFLDDDDEWYPEKTEMQLRKIEECSPSCAVVYCGAEIFSAEGKLTGYRKPSLRGDILSAIKKQGLSTIPSSCLFRRNSLEEIKGYDENLLSHTDHDIWMQLAQAGYSADYIEDALVKVYQHDSYQMTTDVPARIQSIDEFCDKWHSVLSSWWGPKKARRYCSSFKAHVLGMLGWILLDHGKSVQCIRLFLTAIYHQPFHRKYYQGLIASLLGKSKYKRLANFFKRSNESIH